jgi:hypothetical protein
MKKIFTYLAVVFSFLTYNSSAFAQSSACPDIVVTSFKIIVDPTNTCFKKVSIDFINPTNGNKSIHLKVTCGGSTVILDECHDASGQQGVQRNFVSAQFTCCDLSQLNIEIAAYTGNITCLGTPCIVKLSIAGSPLPVLYRSFTATRNNSSVLLKWTTSSEQNNRGFEVERQMGSGIWETVAYVPTSAANGNSSTDISYSYADANNYNGISNYRLRQIDLDGKSKYSEVRTVRGTGDDAKKVTVFPNPGANGRITVLFKNADENYDINIIDASGRMVRQWSSRPGQSLQVTNLPTGFYNLRVISKKTEEQTVTKFIVNN